MAVALQQMYIWLPNSGKKGPNPAVTGVYGSYFTGNRVEFEQCAA